MTNKRVFISFDNDNDKDIRVDQIAQANRLDSPFSMKDESVYGRIDEKWRDEFGLGYAGAILSLLSAGGVRTRPVE